MANIFPLSKPSFDNIIREYVADASLVIDIGDLMYQDTDDAKPASSQADQLNETLNQRLFASKFIGVAASARNSLNYAAAGVVRVEEVTDREMTCASSTFEHGDLVGASEAGSGTALEDQVVEKVTDPDLAIGYVLERKASAATKVWVRLIGKKSGFTTLPTSQPRTQATYYFTGTPAATDTAFFVATRAYRVVAISEVHSVAAGGASVLQVTKDTSTNAPGAGTDLLTNNTNGGFDLNATANTPQVGTLTATAASLELAAGDRLSVDFAQAIQSSAGVLVTVEMVPI